MASIHPCARARGTAYQVRYADLDGTPRMPSFETLDEAEQFRARVELLGSQPRSLGHLRLPRLRPSEGRRVLRRAPRPKPPGDDVDPLGCYVYILWGVDPDLPLYVGQSINVLSRVQSHLAGTRFAGQVERVALVWCQVQDELDRVEVDTIVVPRAYREQGRAVCRRSRHGYGRRRMTARAPLMTGKLLPAPGLRDHPVRAAGT